MEIIYGVDVKMPNDGEEFERTLSMEVSSLNIVAFSSYFLQTLNKSKMNQPLPTMSSIQTAKSSFCVYLFALEQPWNFSLLMSSNVPIVQIIWSPDGYSLLICNQIGTCRIFQMKNGCFNTMESVYQYETNEDILGARFLFYKEPIIVNIEQQESIFYGREKDLNATGDFICITTSATIHTLPLNNSLSTSRYSLSQKDPLSVSLCDLVPTSQGCNIVLGERSQGALIHFFLVHRTYKDRKPNYLSARGRGFRIPSCYGILQSLVYFQRNGTECILTQMNSSTGDFIDLYEFSLEQQEWISITLLNCPNLRITSISLSPSEFFLRDNDFQGQLGRQLLISLNDGSMLVYDKLTLKCREHFYPLDRSDLFKTCPKDRSEFFVRIQHTTSGSCCLGLTESGIFILLRTMSLEQASSVLIQRVIVDLLEQWIVEDSGCSDIWQISCLINNKSFDSAIINNLVDQIVQRYDNQPIEIKRSTFLRFKQCLYHLHRLAFPFTAENCEHLTSLLVYQSLMIVRDYLRLFIYEPSNEHFVDVAQNFLQQPANLQSIDMKRIKYIPDQNVNIETLPVDVRSYQSISFISLINWISDLIFYLIGYLQLQQLPAWLPCKHLFNDYRQIQWLRELIIYFYVLLKTNKISSSKLAHLQPPGPASNENQTNQRDILNDIYQSVSKLAQKLESKNPLQLEDGFLEELSVFEIELLQSKADGLFPKMSPFLIPNSEQIQTFGRGQSPSFATNLVGNPMHCDPLNTHSSNSLTSAIFNEDQNQDGKFDVISFNKLSLSSSSSFRRCLRCGNFSRIYKTKPCPFLISRLNHRCICGGLFILYNRSNSSSTTNNSVTNSSNPTETTVPPSNR